MHVKILYSFNHFPNIIYINPPNSAGLDKACRDLACDIYNGSRITKGGNEISPEEIEVTFEDVKVGVHKVPYSPSPGGRGVLFKCVGENIKL